MVCISNTKPTLIDSQKNIEGITRDGRIHNIELFPQHRIIVVHVFTKHTCVPARGSRFACRTIIWFGYYHNTFAVTAKNCCHCLWSRIYFNSIFIQYNRIEFYVCNYDTERDSLNIIIETVWILHISTVVFRYTYIPYNVLDEATDCCL